MNVVPAGAIFLFFYEFFYQYDIICRGDLYGFCRKNTKVLKGIIIVINILLSLFSLAMLIILHISCLKEVGKLINTIYQFSSICYFFLFVSIYFLVASIFQIINMFKDDCKIDDKIWFFDFFSFATVILVLIFYHIELKWIFLVFILLNFILKLIIVKINKRYFL